MTTYSLPLAAAAARSDGFEYGRQQAGRGQRRPVDFGEYRNSWVEGYLDGFAERRAELEKAS